MTALILLTAPAAVSAEYRIATVDLNRVINESKGSVGKKKQLDEMALKTRKKVDDRKKPLQAVEEKIKSGKIQADSAEGKAFQKDAREFARYMKDAENEMRTEFMKINKELTDKALREVQAYAKTNGIDMVLQKGKDLDSSVLYGVPTSDISNEIIAKMNE